MPEPRARQLVTELWIPSAQMTQITAEAERYRKKQVETGGVLMGFVDGDRAMVTALIGPGPKARHLRYSFAPDTEYQRAAIDAHYDRTSDTYLGDWHSHPTGPAGQSWRDRRMLARLTRDWTEGIEHRPLMLIVAKTEWRTYCANSDTPPRMVPRAAHFAEVTVRMAG